MTSRRVPREEGAFDAWYANFNNNLPAVADELGVTVGERARVANDSPVYSYMILRNDVVRSYKGEESQTKTNVFDSKTSNDQISLPVLKLPPLPDGLKIYRGIEDYANLLVQRIVKSTGFTPAIEALLDIGIKDDDERGDEQLKGFIKEVRATMGAVVLKGSLQGYKSYRVYSQRGSVPDFEPIGDSSQVEFADERPNLVAGQPEKRQYKIVLLEKNKPVGEFSAIETIVTQP